MKLFVVVLRYVRPLTEIDRHLEAHRAWLRDRYREERLLVSGPMQPRTGGVIIARATDVDEVRAMLQADPFGRAGVAEYEVLEFDPSMHDRRIAWAIDDRREVEDSARIVGAFPQALVADVARAASFYREQLGFEVVSLYGQPPFYGLVRRDGAWINLRPVDVPPRHRPEEEQAVLTANLPVERVEALFHEFRARGVTFAQTLETQPWGATDFVVRDPDGNLLCFASVIDATPPPST